MPIEGKDLVVFLMNVGSNVWFEVDEAIWEEQNHPKYIHRSSGVRSKDAETLTRWGEVWGKHNSPQSIVCIFSVKFQFGIDKMIDLIIHYNILIRYH